ncbi:MAG: hypothetical protein LBH43_19040 [Treponema sp.]|jgi:hypothetical protein|nr:hypothetical protein [Treponema sp.]
MPQSNVGIRINIDAGQARGQVEDLSRTIADLNAQLRDAAAARDWQSVAQLTQAVDSASSGRGQIIQQANQAQLQNRQTPFQNNPLNQMMGGQLGWMFQQMATQLVHGILSSFDTALSAAKMRASGDYTGASVAYEKGMGGLAGGGIGAGAGMGIGAAATVLSGGALAPLMPILTSLGNEIGKFAGESGARDKEIALAYSAQYKNALPSIDALNQNFGRDITRKSPDENNKAGLDMYDRARMAASGSGLTVEGFIAATTKLGAYGVQNETQAMNMARADSFLAHRTGADMDKIQSVSGAFSRYAGDDSASRIAYAGLNAQGMVNGQFNEFLTSMGRILEEGISQGFIRGADEIAGNMSLLHKLSGDNPLWQGEQGAQRLSQMNMAISSATNLQSVEDVISFSVARDWFKKIEESSPGDFGLGQDVAVGKGNIKYTGTYVDSMQILERGASPELLRGQWDTVKGLEGGNTAAIIERLKNMYNLNYTGGTQLWAMMRSADSTAGGWDAADLESRAKALFENDDYKSDSAKLQDILNDLKTNGIKAGKLEFDNTEINLLRQEAEKLVEILRGKQTDNSRAVTSERLEAMTDVTRPLLGQTFDYDPTRNLRFEMNLGKINRYENTTGFLGLGGHDYGEEEAERFRGIIGTINDPSNVSEEVIYAIEAYAQKFEDSTKGLFNGVNDTELAELKTLSYNIERLIESMNRNTNATNDNTTEGRELNVHLIES